MNPAIASFNATVLFAQLMLVLLFLLNAVAWFAQGEAGHAFGMWFAVAAAALSNYAQAKYTEAAQWGEVAIYDGTSAADQVAAETKEAAAERLADRVRLAAWIVGGVAFVIFPFAL